MFFIRREKRERKIDKTKLENNLKYRKTTHLNKNKRMVTNIQIRGKLKYYTKPYGRQWKWRYQVHGRIVEPELQVPKALEGVKIIDPLRPETLPKEPVAKWVPPRRHPILEGFFPQLTLKDHPNFNQQPIKMFDRSVKFHAGLDQVSLLTKTKIVDRLPNSIDFKLADELINPEKVHNVFFLILKFSCF